MSHPDKENEMKKSCRLDVVWYFVNLSAAAGKFGEYYGQRTKVYSHQSVLPLSTLPSENLSW